MNWSEITAIMNVLINFSSLIYRIVEDLKKKKDKSTTSKDSEDKDLWCDGRYISVGSMTII